MPRSGVAYRAYFFTSTQVAWFDATVDGQRTWSRTHLIEDLWPGLTGIFPDNAGVPSAVVQGVHPVSSTVLSVMGGSANFMPTTYVDVAKGALVPNPRAYSSRPVITHTPSWDVGPIVLYRNADGTANLVDLRDDSAGPAQPFPLDSTSPMIAIPDEPLRWFTSDVPQNVASRVGNTTVVQPVSAVFPELPLTGPIVEATILYGAAEAALADATAALTDADVRAVVDLAGPLGARGEELLAALYLLSGLRPGAYHPQGYYGIAQLSAQQLPVGGWTDPPAAILDASGQRQIGVLSTYLGTFPFHAGAHWQLAALLSGTPLTDQGDATVVARAPYPPRLRALEPVTANGVVADTITVADLRNAINAVLAGPLHWELRNRAAEISLA